MASEKKITMREYNGTDYDTLYPKTIAEQVDGVYSKDEVLSNSTKALYGLTDSAVPDNVFSLLANFKSNYVSQYLWEKYKAIIKSNFNSYISSSEYTLARISTSSTDSEYSYDYTLYYADSYYIDTDNKFHLKNYTAGLTFNRNNYNDNVSKFNVLKGKYVIAFDTHYGIVFDGSSNNMLLINTNANFTVSNSYPYWYLYVSGSTVYNYPLGWVEKQDLSYLTSDSPTAYPPVIDDGYTYNLLGLVGDGPHKVEIKRYVGTGTWGASNPTILTFDKDPLMVMMLGWYDSARWRGADSNWDTGNRGNRTIVFPQLMGSSWESEQGLYSGDAYNNQVQGKYENKKLYCYAQANSNPTTNDRSYVQFNQKDYVYAYMVVY